MVGVVEVVRVVGTYFCVTDHPAGRLVNGADGLDGQLGWLGRSSPTALHQPRC